MDEYTETPVAPSVSCFGRLVGSSEKMNDVYNFIRLAAKSRSAVLLQGETGTGKELVARAIHLAGPWSDRPFVAVDCPSLPPTLIETELFGHKRGAFTGAVMHKVGLIQAAGDGSLFLDEIGDLSKEMQVRLLRVTETHEVRAVGSNSSVPVGARIIAATHRDLSAAIRTGDFREDLYYRIGVLCIELPPLRERKSDIPLLAQAILRSLYEEHNEFGAASPSTISEDALRLLAEYHWPGNIRELRNCLERAMMLGSDTEIDIADISFDPDIEVSVASEGGPLATLNCIEKEAIMRTLSYTRGDKISAAKILGIGKTTLYRKLKIYHEGIRSDQAMPWLGRP
jgi:two-component system response regulator HydG